MHPRKGAERGSGAELRFLHPTEKGHWIGSQKPGSDPVPGGWVTVGLSFLPGSPPLPHEAQGFQSHRVCTAMCQSHLGIQRNVWTQAARPPCQGGSCVRAVKRRRDAKDPEPESRREC